MKHDYVTAACRVGVLAGIAALAACAGTGEGNDGRNGVRIVSGAYPDGEDTRMAYEYDGEAHRVVWSEGDALRVAAFADGARVADGGRLWSRFDMVTDGGFDASYMLFAGDALVPPDAGPFSQQRLYALYPAGMLAGDADDSLLFPAVQAYSPDAFDTEAVLMVAAPVEAEIPQEGTVHTAPFRFAHYTGYLRLSPKDMPAALSDERVSRIVLESLEGVPMAGGFTVSIDDAGGGWTLVPGADTESTVTLDCSGSTVTVGELGDCWFALLPGNYGRVAVTVATESGAAVRMERDGLAMASGVVKVQDIHFGSGDTVSRTFTMDGGDLGIREYVNGETLTGTENGVEFGFLKLKYTVSGSDKYMEFGKRGGMLWNTAALPGRVVSVEVDCTEAYNSRFIEVGMGTSSGTYEYTRMGTTSEFNSFEAPDGSDYRYVSIENTGTAAAVVRSIRIICVQAG